MKFSLCLTTYNRTNLLYESYEKIIDDKRIDEVIIIDDCSTPEIWGELQKNCTHPKIWLRQNEENLGMLRNKKEAVESALNEWCILFDSDNVLDGSYLDALQGCLMTPNTIFCPEFARPQFDYRQYADKTIDKDNASILMSDRMGRCLYNTCNYVVNRDEYLKVWKPNQSIKGSDTIWFNYNWLLAGNEFFVVKGMQYDHRVHEGSGWKENAEHNIKSAKEIEQLISNL